MSYEDIGGKIKKIDLAECQNVFEGPMVKGVVDVEDGLLVIDAEMHADLEQFLLIRGCEYLEDGSGKNDAIL